MSASTAQTYVNRAIHSAKSPQESIELLAKAIEELIKEVKRLKGTR
jgi:hypothetical protein